MEQHTIFQVPNIDCGDAIDCPSDSTLMPLKDVYNLSTVQGYSATSNILLCPGPTSRPPHPAPQY
eukprot:13750961-Ditylum_brightwellii.AAC.1